MLLTFSCVEQTYMQLEFLQDTITYLLIYILPGIALPCLLYLLSLASEGKHSGGATHLFHLQKV